MGAHRRSAPRRLARPGDLEQAFGVICHACQSEIILPAGESVGFREACDRCRADLHVCLNCVHHDPSAYNECHEPNAERLLDRDRANRCEYFRPTSQARAGDSGREKAMADLENLFKKG